MSEYTPSDVEKMKKQINDDLDIIVKRFNDDYDAWQKRTKSDAIFRWVYTTRKELVKESVTIPVYRKEATESDLQKAVELMSNASCDKL